jgi:hypothetical protein
MSNSLNYKAFASVTGSGIARVSLGLVKSISIAENKNVDRRYTCNITYNMDQ